VRTACDPRTTLPAFWQSAYEAGPRLAGWDTTSFEPTWCPPPTSSGNCVMKHAGTTALMVLDARTGQPAGIITEADIAHAVADGKDVNRTRIHALMTTRPTVINATTSVRDAAKVMTSGHFRHLPVVGDVGLVGIVDITDVCRVLLEPDVSPPPAGMAPPE
jgi:signal-transduction protein with cAMP-binding, CBS, and nucleotidyltransferase domain